MFAYQTICLPGYLPFLYSFVSLSSHLFIHSFNKYFSASIVWRIQPVLVKFKTIWGGFVSLSQLIRKIIELRVIGFTSWIELWKLHWPLNLNVSRHTANYSFCKYLIIYVVWMSLATLSYCSSRNWQVKGWGIRLKILGETSANFLVSVSPCQIDDKEKCVLGTS